MQYLDYYFSCHTGAGQGGSAGHALDYELEYCIGGKASDRENLEKTVKELLLLREAGNFATIMQDTGKQAVALEIAAAAVGFTGIAPLVQAVKIGILMAWSYIESIQDVRILLKGGSVPLIKKPSEWKSDISVGTRALEKKAEKEEAERGFSYREYLLILLLLKSEKTLAYRAMDVIEQNIRLLPGKEKFRMDFQAYKIRAAGLYTAQPMFLSFVSAGHKVDGAYGFAAEREASYL